MSIKDFIDRSIMSVIVAVSMVIIGIISLLNLPLEQYPEIAPHAVRSATYYRCQCRDGNEGCGGAVEIVNQWCGKHAVYVVDRIK